MGEGRHDCIKNLVRNQLSPDAMAGIYQCSVCKLLVRIEVLEAEKLPGCFEDACYEPGCPRCLDCDVKDRCRERKFVEVEKA